MSGLCEKFGQVYRLSFRPRKEIEPVKIFNACECFVIFLRICPLFFLDGERALT